jgi:Small metal-binding protein
MQQKHCVLTCAGSFLLVIASASYAADMPTDAGINPPPEAAINPQPEEQMSVAAETPSDARVNTLPQDRMSTDPVGCADQPGNASGALDCERLKRRMGDSPKAALGTSMAACTSHMDAKGNVVYDDPTCPSRISPVVNNPKSVYLIRENPFFNLHIEKAIGHARAAEIAGNQGQAPELLQHTQMSLDRAKEAQRAGNVPGLNEAIISLREALRLPEASSVREATAYVRDARKNLAQANGVKFVEVQPQGVVATTR